jgi:hypothetical protein
MSGRAGRRGKDTHGTVIVCVDEGLELDTAKDIVQARVFGFLGCSVRVVCAWWCFLCHNVYNASRR